MTVFNYNAIVIGVSSGGLAALSEILPCLPVDYFLPIIVVQHLHASIGKSMVRILNDKCPITVKEANEKETIKAGSVYLAPSNYHLLIELDRTFSLSLEEKINFSRPSIDVLFETAANCYGSGLIGIILTGANEDGCRGLQSVKMNGGLTIVQDPNTAEVSTMPRAAIAATKVDKILPLSSIGPYLAELHNKNKPNKKDI